MRQWVCINNKGYEEELQVSKSYGERVDRTVLI